MQLFAYAAAAVWTVGNLILGSWAVYLSFKIENRRIRNEPLKPSWGGAKFAFQKDASDYTEAGQMYRCKAIKVEFALFAWAFSIPYLVGIVSGGK
jgi:hypothetical protein